ncbi:unnamed protein product, partial [Musa banksii]
RRVPPALVTSLRPPRISSSTTSADSPSSRTELVFVLPRGWSGSARPSHHGSPIYLLLQTHLRLFPKRSSSSVPNHLHVSLIPNLFVYYYLQFFAF